VKPRKPQPDTWWLAWVVIGMVFYIVLALSFGS
jgi:hypothetical protein